MDRFSDHPPRVGGASNLRRAFEARAQALHAMEPPNNPDRGDRNLQRLDSYIDNNFMDIERYADGYHEPMVNDNDVPSDNFNNYQLNRPVSYEEIQSKPSTSDQWEDGMSLQRRTTSMHRNRFHSGNIEEQRRWTDCAATLSRQPLGEHVEKIVNYMKQDRALNEDTQEAEQLRREALRNMPQCLAIKKQVKRKFVGSISTSKNVGMFKMLKYQIAMSWSHLKSNVKDLSYTFELWYSSLKTIEGNFGSGVASYFKFLRWLFLINLATTILCVCFITIPQAVLNVPSNDETFSALNLLNGDGYLNQTLFYYGSYSNDAISGYEIDKAYFFTMPVVYIAVFILMSVSMATSYRRSFIETRGGLQNVFAHKIFCSWDYSITQTKAASLKSKSIYNELNELVSEITRHKDKLSFCDKFRLYTMQSIAHIFAVAVSLSAGYLMYYLLDSLSNNGKEKSESEPFLLAVYINIVMVGVPMIFRVIASYEDYKNPKVTLFITLARTIFLEMCVIGVLIYYGLNKAEQESREYCWENNLAQEVYRLILFDFFFSTLLMTLIDLVWYIMHKTKDSFEAPEFDIATNTLSLIYNQTLFWVGFYFSPLLGAMVVLKLFLTWYVRSFVLLRCCQGPKKTWRAAQTESWFLIIAFLWSLILLFVHGYHIFKVDSSKDCGPFKEKEIDNFITFGKNDVIQFFFKPGVIACVLIALAFGVYYLRAVANAQIDMVNFLRHRLVLAAKDKEFLLNNINKASAGAFKYKKSEKQEDLIDPTKLAPGINRPNPSTVDNESFDYTSQGNLVNYPPELSY